MKNIWNILKRFSWLIVLIPIYLYFYNLYVYGQNIPHWDDYAIRTIVDKIHNSSSFFEKLRLVFAQHNEHRIAFTRIMALITVQIGGQINFLWMQWLGSFALIGMLYLFFKVLKANQLSGNYLIPIGFFLFQLSHYENTYWAMASVQNFWVVLFVLLSFWQIANGKIPYLWFTLAAFTSANGVLFVPMVGLLAFVFSGNYKNLIKFSILSSFVLLVYFVFYQKPPDSQPIDLSNLLLNFKATFVNFGSIADLNFTQNIDKRVLTTLITGLIIGFAFIVIWLQMYFEPKKWRFSNNKNLIFFGSILLFVLATCAVTTLSRIQYGFYVFLVSRYKIYSIIIICSLYLLLIIKYRYFGKTFVFLAFTFLSVYTYCISYFYSIGEIKNYHKAEIASFYNGWHKGEISLPKASTSLFNYKNTFLDIAPAMDLTPKTYILGKVLMDSVAINIQNKDFHIDESSPSNGVYLEVSSENKSYIFATNQERLNNKKQFFFKNGRYYGKGFTVTIPLEEIETGNYFINILEKKSNSFERILTNYYIEIEGIKKKPILQNW